MFYTHRTGLKSVGLTFEEINIRSIKKSGNEHSWDRQTINFNLIGRSFTT